VEETLLPLESGVVPRGAGSGARAARDCGAVEVWPPDDQAQARAWECCLVCG
jgi:hypothetical protein